jgi:hypothetical protein
MVHAWCRLPSFECEALRVRSFQTEGTDPIPAFPGRPACSLGPICQRHDPTKVSYCDVDLASLESLVTVLSFLTAYLLRAHLPSSFFGQVFPFQSYLGLLVVILVLWNILFALIRIRKQGLAQDWFEVSQEVSLTVFAGTVLISAAIFVLKYEFISRPFIAIFAVVNFLFLCAFRIYAKAGVSQFPHS